MHIQPINNVANVSSKGLYFAKPGILFNRSANYLNNNGALVSKTGVRYFEDTSIPQKIKDAVENNKYIRDLASKFDTFVCYSCNIGPFSKKWIAQLHLSWADYTEKYASQRQLFSDLENDSKESAEDSLIKNMEKQFVHK